MKQAGTHLLVGIGLADGDGDCLPLVRLLVPLARSLSYLSCLVARVEEGCPEDILVLLLMRNEGDAGDASERGSCT